MKKNKKPSPFFPKLVDHIDASWLKLKGMHYPFAGRDFRDLKAFSRSFKEWGVMALWDVFIASDSDWVLKSGYSVGAFVKCIPWLVDDLTWKAKSKRYESQIANEMPSDLLPIFDQILKGAKDGRNNTAV